MDLERLNLSWRWWPLTTLCTSLLEVMILHWSKMFGSVPICTTDEDEGDEVVNCNTSGTLSPMASLLSRVSVTGRCIPSWPSATLMTFSSVIQKRLLCQVDTSRPKHRSLLYIKPEPSLWFVPGIPHVGWKTETFKVRIVDQPVPETSLCDHKGKPSCKEQYP